GPVPRENLVCAGVVEFADRDRWAPITVTSVLVSVLAMLGGAVRSRAALHLEILAPSTASAATISTATAASWRSRPVALGLAVGCLEQLANGARHRETGDGHRLASAGRPVVLTWTSRRRKSRPSIAADVRSLVQSNVEGESASMRTVVVKA